MNLTHAFDTTATFYDQAIINYKISVQIVFTCNCVTKKLFDQLELDFTPVDFAIILKTVEWVTTHTAIGCKQKIKETWNASSKAKELVKTKREQKRTVSTSMTLIPRIAKFMFKFYRFIHVAKKAIEVAGEFIFEFLDTKTIGGKIDSGHYLSFYTYIGIFVTNSI